MHPSGKLKVYGPSAPSWGVKVCCFVCDQCFCSHLWVDFQEVRGGGVVYGHEEQCTLHIIVIQGSRAGRGAQFWEDIFQPELNWNIVGLYISEKLYTRTK